MTYLEECQIKDAIAKGIPQEPVDPQHPLVREWVRNETRRQFLSRGKNVLGMAAFGLLGGEIASRADSARPNTQHLTPNTFRNFAPKAKHVIYLHMVGGPPQMDLYD